MSAKPTRVIQEEQKASPALSELDIQSIKGVGPKYALCLSAKGIRTVYDALYFLPRRYEDRRSTKTIEALIPEELACFEATVVAVQAKRTRRYRTLMEVLLTDGTGEIRCIWFRVHAASFRKQVQVGDRFRVAGRLDLARGVRQIVHPDLEKVDACHASATDEKTATNFQRLVPIYPEVEGLPPKTVRKIIQQAVLGHVDQLTDGLPTHLLGEHGLPSLAQALRQVHFPALDQDPSALSQLRTAGQQRLIFEELFLIQVGLAYRQQQRNQRRARLTIQPTKLDQLVPKLFGFALTQSQSRALSEIVSDMQRTRPMNRLLQGDVGSGKTAVALLACLAVVQSGAQAALMVPTEVLAEQHFRSLSQALGGTQEETLRLGYLSSALNAKARQSTLQRLKSGALDLIIGTQALLQSDVHFANLGLVLIDEQHRFGVRQRLKLRDKGLRPHVLVMTATPIPRTLSMTLYGDLDISIVDQLPPGRSPVRTKLLRSGQVKQAFGHIRQEVQAGGQAFVVYPLVAQSENRDLLDASRAFEKLNRGALAGLRLGLVHGRLDADEKEQTMTRFANGELDVLICTTVIEVGVDVPNASMMVIEHAERFGLSQLHQLRGRVGRGTRPGHCYLIAHSLGSADARSRLKVMEQTTDGFVIAEQDLAIRGPGEFIGTRQSGLFQFNLADLTRDEEILHQARRAAFALVQADPNLQEPSHQALRQALQQRLGERLRLAGVG